MKAEYKRNLQHNYLILEAPGTADEEGYDIHMVMQNEIPGLLPFEMSGKNGIRYFQYEITSKQALDSIYEKRTLSGRDIFSLLSHIRDTLELLRKYLLNPARLLFAPQYIYLTPDRQKVFLCYFPAPEGETPVTELAEFILKKLDHGDPQAVELGYQFYRQAIEENFSLRKALKEILESAGTEQELPQPDCRFGPDGQTPEEQKDFPTAQEAPETFWQPAADMYEEEYEVIHKERKRHSGAKTDAGMHSGNEKKTKDVPSRLFQMIHPAVLLSGLLLLAALEAVYYFGFLDLTGAGGVFFLVISVEALINKSWRDRKKKRQQEQWFEEDEDEMYQLLREEMYDAPEPETQIEETQCLAPGMMRRRLHLVCAREEDSDRMPEIRLDREILYIGKLKGESDVILDSPAVSRVHAQLCCQEQTYYVKDLNSKNGTFVNGERLKPQERCSFAANDLIAFADMEYRAVWKHSI